MLAEKSDHLHHVEELGEEVERRVHAGDLARSDGLLAQQEVLGAQADVSMARTAANEALAKFRLLTGHRNRLSTMELFPPKQYKSKPHDLLNFINMMDLWEIPGLYSTGREIVVAANSGPVS